MARGILFGHFVYEVDNGDVDSPSIVSTMFIKMDKFNIGTTVLVPSSETQKGIFEAS